VKPSPLAALLLATLSLGQTASPPLDPKHDISMVETAPADGAIATPLPQKQRKKLQKYDLPELAGSRQALGSQLVNGELPKPLVDYIESSGEVRQRISIFEGGLVVVDLASAAASIRKKLLIPTEALDKYLEAASPKMVEPIRQTNLTLPVARRKATLRVYEQHAPAAKFVERPFVERPFVERSFDPMSALPKPLTDAVIPLQDLMRAICEDREVTNSIANYTPKAGDELVGDDRNIYRVVRVISGRGMVELRCLTQPTSIYVKTTDLHNYFIGKPAAKR
jgi:hypothetical protein